MKRGGSRHIARAVTSVRFRRAAAGVTAAGAAWCLVGACGSSQSTPAGAAGPGTIVAAPASTNGEVNRGEGSGDAPAIAFVSPTAHYRVDAPGPMTEDARGTARAESGAERLTITVNHGAAASDPDAVANADIDNLRPIASFALRSAPAPVRLPASSAARKAVYSVTDGTSVVTGKPNDRVVVKYWVPRDAAALAVLTYSVAANQYDPQGADDIANTLQWQ